MCTGLRAKWSEIGNGNSQNEGKPEDRRINVCHARYPSSGNLFHFCKKILQEQRLLQRYLKLDFRKNIFSRENLMLMWKSTLFLCKFASFSHHQQLFFREKKQQFLKFRIVKIWKNALPDFWKSFGSWKFEENWIFEDKYFWNRILYHTVLVWIIIIVC